MMNTKQRALKQCGPSIVSSPCMYQMGTVYLLSVTASDRGPDSLPAHATVVVRVEDVNDHSPQISVNTLTTSGIAEVRFPFPSVIVGAGRSFFLFPCCKIFVVFPAFVFPVSIRTRQIFTKFRIYVRFATDFAWSDMDGRVSWPCGVILYADLSEKHRLDH